MYVDRIDDLIRKLQIEMINRVTSANAQADHERTLREVAEGSLKAVQEALGSRDVHPGGPKEREKLREDSAWAHDTLARVHEILGRTIGYGKTAYVSRAEETAEVITRLKRGLARCEETASVRADRCDKLTEELRRLKATNHGLVVRIGELMEQQNVGTVYSIPDHPDTVWRVRDVGDPEVIYTRVTSGAYKGLWTSDGGGYRTWTELLNTGDVEAF